MSSYCFVCGGFGFEGNSENLISHDGKLFCSQKCITTYEGREEEPEERQFENEFGYVSDNNPKKDLPEALQWNVVKRELVNKRVPKECPFCRNIDDVSWTEFEVHVADVFYIDTEGTSKQSDVSIRVFCSRCKEEVLPKDVGIDEGEQE